MGFLTLLYLFSNICFCCCLWATMKATGLPSIFLCYPYNGHFFIVCETSAFEFLFHDQFILNSWTTFSNFVFRVVLYKWLGRLIFFLGHSPWKWHSTDVLWWSSCNVYINSPSWWWDIFPWHRKVRRGISKIAFAFGKIVNAILYFLFVWLSFVMSKM